MFELFDIYGQVTTERIRQNNKWGKQEGHPVNLWMSILMEEVGELARAANDNDRDNFHEEVIQVAAVATAIAQHLEDIKW